MMKKMTVFPLVALLCAFLLAGCADPGVNLENQIVPPGGATPEPTEAVPTLEVVIPANDGPESEKPPVEHPVIRIAREDLAAFLGVPVNTVSLALVEEVTWSDASLGCPQPGAVYPQVLTSGFYLVLSVEGVEYVYHTDMVKQVVQCADTREGDQTVADTLEPDLNLIVNQAREDLMARLGVAQDAVEVVLYEAVVWPDAGLGCPQPGMKYKQVPQDGARVVLRAENALYTYHSGGGRAPFLCEQPLQLLKKTPGADEIVPPPGYDE